MTIRLAQFFAIVITALALIPSGAHLAALPNKIGLPQTEYYTVQSIYTGWAILGLLWPAAVIANGLLAFLVRRQAWPFWLAVASAAIFVLMLAIFLLWTFPANQATENWTVVPQDWEALRRQWEYSHAVNAVLVFLAFCLTTLSALWWRLAGPEINIRGDLVTAVPERPAFAPWKASFLGEGGKRQLIEAAILAANAHNSQPWRFEIAGERILVVADLERHLGPFDPFRREMHQSLGCALENLALAAGAHGLRAEIETPPGHLPPETSDVAAVVRLAPTPSEADPLVRAIPVRHTNRGAYEKRAVPSDVLDALHAHAHGSESLRLVLLNDTDKAPLGDLIVSATREIVADVEMARDNAKWFRFRKRDIATHRDGLTLDANVLPPVTNFFAKLFPPSPERANRQWIKDTESIHVRTAALLGVICVRDLYDCATAIAAGRLWQRLHLELTTRGIAAQPLNQPLESVDRERQLGLPARAEAALARVLGPESMRPTFIFRAGYPTRPAAPSPRRALDDVLEA